MEQLSIVDSAFISFESGESPMHVMHERDQGQQNGGTPK
jgi:hypothetical protein